MRRALDIIAVLAGTTATFALLVLLLFALVAFTPAAFGQTRSAAVRAEFQRLNPCPSTGKPTGRCPGYVVDHVVPLCAEGRDHVSNLRWQPLRESLEKDKAEISLCAWIRRLRGRA